MSVVLDNNKYTIKFLEWDTKMFEEKSAKIILKQKISQENLKDIEKYVRKEEYTFVTVENKNNNESNNILIGELNNIFLADVNVQFKKCGLMLDGQHTNKNIKIENKCKVNNEIIDMSKSAFIWSRFINDNKLNVNKYNVYSEWVRNSFNKENKYFCYLIVDNVTLGYILFSIEGEELIIELIAINKEKKSMGIGSELLKTVERFSVNNHIKTIKVGTQINNIQAQNFYIKNGFRHIQNNSIYHWWLESKKE